MMRFVMTLTQAAAGGAPFRSLQCDAVLCNGLEAAINGVATSWRGSCISRSSSSCGKDEAAATNSERVIYSTISQHLANLPLCVRQQVRQLVRAIAQFVLEWPVLRKADLVDLLFDHATLADKKDLKEMLREGMIESLSTAKGVKKVNDEGPGQLPDKLCFRWPGDTEEYEVLVGEIGDGTVTMKELRSQLRKLVSTSLGPERKEAVEVLARVGLRLCNLEEPEIYGALATTSLTNLRKRVYRASLCFWMHNTLNVQELSRRLPKKRRVSEGASNTCDRFQGLYKKFADWARTQSDALQFENLDDRFVAKLEEAMDEERQILDQLQRADEKMTINAQWQGSMAGHLFTDLLRRYMTTSDTLGRSDSKSASRSASKSAGRSDSNSAGRSSRRSAKAAR